MAIDRIWIAFLHAIKTNMTAKWFDDKKNIPFHEEKCRVLFRDTTDLGSGNLMGHWIKDQESAPFGH